MKSKSKQVTYQEYLKIPELLSLQKPLSNETESPAHEEMLFIITHQVYELWFKQILHELDSVLELFGEKTINESQMGIILSRFERITEIQKLLIEQIRIIETMSPSDFLEFRDLLAPASGFQSVQFRLLEIKMGLEKENRILFEKRAYSSALNEDQRANLEIAENSLSLFDGVNHWLERTPFLDFEGFSFWDSYRDAVNENLMSQKKLLDSKNLSQEEKLRMEKNYENTRKNFEAIIDETKHNEMIETGQKNLSYKALQAALLIFLYRDQPVLFLPYRLLTGLIEMDENLTSWRYRHALMAHRMIGMKTGTGGSSGYSYLRATAERHKVFRDFTNLTTFFLPRSKLPVLPKEVQKKLGFYYSHTMDSK
jgi:tryptophan 2,3-dioxygenase